MNDPHDTAKHYGSNHKHRNDPRGRNRVVVINVIVVLFLFGHLNPF